MLRFSIFGILKLGLGIALIYVTYCGLLFLLQRHVMFPRFAMGPAPETTDRMPGIEKIWLDTASGKIESWFILPVTTTGAGPAIIFAHGNGELIDFWPHELRPFADLGIGVLLVEYPGYGRSAGRPSQKSITDAFVQAYDTLISRPEVDPERVVLFGRSIGGGAACALARERPVKAMILMSAFTDIPSFTRRYLAPAFIVRDPFDNLEVIKSFSNPVLIIHGTRDEIIPYRHGETLDRHALDGTMISYDAGHNDCPPDWRVFFQDVVPFLVDAGVIGLFR